ncbi:MAG: hydrogenase maturation nickel metallochaperone HypA [Candidatus Omnitrophica bacterium]|nr:hydrogenase maturation nickel metallochaperone HypA [Candidatus Omnitrophota bacterium]
MHEVHQVQKVVAEALATVKDKNIKNPTKAVLLVGELLGFDEGCIRLYWEQMIADTVLSNTVLEVKFTPALLECKICNIQYPKKGSDLQCPQCRKLGTLLPSGKEFFISEIV